MVLPIFTVVLPLVVAAFLSLIVKGKPARYIALAGSLVSLGMVALLLSITSNAPISWFSLPGLSVMLTASTQPINLLLLQLIAAITPLIFIYSIGFMDVPSEQGRYYFEICLFAAAMMLFAIAGDFITMLIGWELLGVTSYLLIGFWYKKERPPLAARKAITTIIIGDVLMLMAALLLWNSYGTFSFASIISQGAAPLLPMAMVLVALAAFTKSAQFPFHEWLPDAMEGPTPVSAFLHSSTMVKAGIFLIMVLLPLFIAANMLPMLLIIGVITALIGVTNALAENHIKRVLAYSTIEDLGLMTVALGLGSLPAALTLFVVQTFYKALLFMSAGSIMRANNNEESITNLFVPSTSKALIIATIIGVLSLAGIFPLSGFFGKAGIESASNSIIVYAILSVIGFASSIYIFRWFLIPLRKQAQKRGVLANFRTLPKPMLAATYITAALVVYASLLYLGVLPWLSLTPAPIPIAAAAAETTITLIGLSVAYVAYMRLRLKKMSEAHRAAYLALYNNLAVNAAYSLIARLFNAIAWVVEGIDRNIYRAFRTGAISPILFARLLRRMEDGQANAYVAAFILGTLLLLIILVV
ncbi:MAG: NADH-quinone oxidoreductase subunit L [Candidatus Micrarchaeota archaeon]|nr:NADH-quinone oxidoreductase subunit L [Candidatus Micrarchaeota archaeon]